MAAEPVEETVVLVGQSRPAEAQLVNTSLANNLGALARDDILADHLLAAVPSPEAHVAG